MDISQSELDKTMTGCRNTAPPESPKPKAPALRKFSALYSKKFPANPCAITQDELDRTLRRGKS
jgi:hypothetical protein